MPVHPTLPLRLIPLALLALAALGGCSSTRQLPKDYVEMRPRFVVEDPTGDPYATAVTLPVSQVTIPVRPKAVLSEFQIVGVETTDLEMGKALRFELSREGARSFYRFSLQNQGRRLVLLVNGAPLGARRIGRPMEDGSLTLYAELQEEELEDLVRNLDATVRHIQAKLDS